MSNIGLNLYLINDDDVLLFEKKFS